MNKKVGNFTSGNYKAVTGLAYDSTNKKLGLKVGADTVIPFSSSNIELLWTNPSPSANFPAQTLLLDLTDYEAIIIELKHDASATEVRRELCIKGYSNRILTSTNGKLIGGDFWGRNVTVNNNSLVFGAPTTAYSQIPTRIYGVKFEDFASVTPIG